MTASLYSNLPTAASTGSGTTDGASRTHRHHNPHLHAAARRRLLAPSAASCSYLRQEVAAVAVQPPVDDLLVSRRSSTVVRSRPAFLLVCRALHAQVVSREVKADTTPVDGARVLGRMTPSGWRRCCSGVLDHVSSALLGAFDLCEQRAVGSTLGRFGNRPWSFAWLFAVMCKTDMARNAPETSPPRAPQLHATKSRRACVLDGDPGWRSRSGATRPCGGCANKRDSEVLLAGAAMAVALADGVFLVLWSLRKAEVGLLEAASSGGRIVVDDWRPLLGSASMKQPSTSTIRVVLISKFEGINTVFFGLALYSICRKPAKSAITCVILAVFVFTQLHGLCSSLPTRPCRSRTEIRQRTANNVSEPLVVPEEALFMFNMIVRDSVVIWRVWSIYGRSLRAIAIPALFLLVSLGFAITDTVCLTSSLHGPPSCTLLIGIKAWKHRRLMRTLAASSSSRFWVDRVLSLLVESGSIYCAFWLTQVVLFIPTTNNYVFYIFSALGDQISGL
ncbi:hypothetical protein HMN09_00131400 [Mycena chlorophos]|uniref:Uncharacterized protein n=1 Tax=Mycena chlorophos TaxID=658473 RepID=A0A8H6TK75_MYCCL|nr:hypothetical protein HMN09_00131400 [Mycena chlorophos]